MNLCVEDLKASKTDRVLAFVGILALILAIMGVSWGNIDGTVERSEVNELLVALAGWIVIMLSIAYKAFALLEEVNLWRIGVVLLIAIPVYVRLACAGTPLEFTGNANLWDMLVWPASAVFILVDMRLLLKAAIYAVCRKTTKR